jgi:hypothetical protein
LLSINYKYKYNIYRMNSQNYRTAYLSNLKREIAINNKHATANMGAPAVQQYMQNSGKQVLGASTYNSFKGETGVQAKGTKWNGFK